MVRDPLGCNFLDFRPILLHATTFRRRDDVRLDNARHEFDKTLRLLLGRLRFLRLYWSWLLGSRFCHAHEHHGQLLFQVLFRVRPILENGEPSVNL